MKRSLIRAAVLGCLILPACHLPEAIDEATSPNAEGKTPVQQIAEQVPNIIQNPASPFPWIEVLGTAGFLIATAFTGKRYWSKKAAAANSTPAFMQRIGLTQEVIEELVQIGVNAIEAARKTDPKDPPEVRPAGEPAAEGAK